MPGLPGPFELLIILLIILVIFGASRLTDVMGAFGRGIAEFRKGTETGKSDAGKEEPKKEEAKPESNTETPKSA